MIASRYISIFDIGNSPEHDEVNSALAEVWARNLPLVRERVQTIERAAAAAARDELDADLAAEARGAAHKLAGSLGSFGLNHGSDLARVLEERFEAGERLQGDAELVDLAAALGGEIER